MTLANDPIVIVSAVRTPMGGLQGDLKSLTAPQLGAAAIRAAVERAGIASDSVEQVLRTMQERKVRRLPVVDREGRLAGIVSLGDVAVRANGRADQELHEEVFEALRSISEPPPSDTPAAAANA